MLYYDFIKAAYSYIKMYKAFPLPILLCDTGLRVHWSNPLAKTRFPGLVVESGVRDLLEEFDLERLRAQVYEDGSATIRDIYQPKDLSLNLSFMEQGGDVVGYVVLCLPDDIDNPPSSWATQGSDALTSSIREAVSDIFSALDSLSAKADMMRVQWLKPGLNQVGVKSYGILRIAGNVTQYTNCRREGGEGLRLATVNLHTLLCELRPTVEELCGMAGIPILFDPIPKNLFVPLDVGKFEVAFYNLLHNCITYTKPGNRIHITVANIGKDIQLTIADKGMGIPPERMEDVLRPYATYRRENGAAGAGLGLPLAKLITEAHGGRFRLSSREGMGTTATLQLPGSSFSQLLPLAQDVPTGAASAQDRFSAAYVGLMDAVCRTASPSV